MLKTIGAEFVVESFLPREPSSFVTKLFELLCRDTKVLLPLSKLSVKGVIFMFEVRTAKWYDFRIGIPVDGTKLLEHFLCHRGNLDRLLMLATGIVETTDRRDQELPFDNGQRYIGTISGIMPLESFNDTSG